MTKDWLIKRLKESLITQQLKLYGIKHLSLFGSYVQNTSNEESDVDLLYETDGKYELGLDFFSLVLFLEKKLKKKVDLIDKKYLNDDIKEDVLAHKIDIL